MIEIERYGELPRLQLLARPSSAFIEELCRPLPQV